MRKIVALVLCVFMILGAVGCVGNVGEKIVGTKVDTSLKDGDILPEGDFFELPEIKQDSGAPVLAEITKQVYPGESVVISGEGFKAEDLKIFVYS